MEMLYINGKRYKKVKINEQYREILQTSFGERNRFVNNILELMDEHFKDTDANYLQSEEYARLVTRAKKAFNETFEKSMGIICNVIKENEGVLEVPLTFMFDKDEYEYDSLLYELRPAQ